MTVADCSGFTNLPKHHEVWIVGFDNILPMVNDELRSFRQKDPQNRNYIIEKDAMSFCWNQVSLDEYSVFRLPSVLYFISDVAWEGDDYGGDISLLYSMLIPEDFEALITQILLDRSDAHFIPDEDSIIGIFTRHERMKSLLKAANSQKKP